MTRDGAACRIAKVFEERKQKENPVWVWSPGTEDDLQLLLTALEALGLIKFNDEPIFNGEMGRFWTAPAELSDPRPLDKQAIQQEINDRYNGVGPEDNMLNMLAEMIVYNNPRARADQRDGWLLGGSGANGLVEALAKAGFQIVRKP